MIILIDKVDGYFNLRTIQEFLLNAANGCYKFNITKQRRGRTINQNEWLWGCIYPILLDGLLDAGWEFTSVKQVHEYFKSLMAREKVVNRHTGEIVEFPSSTATMDTLEFSTYCGKLREYAHEYLGVEIPIPRKGWEE